MYDKGLLERVFDCEGWRLGERNFIGQIVMIVGRKAGYPRQVDFLFRQIIL